MAGTPSKGRHKPRRKARSSDDDFQMAKSDKLYRAPAFPLAAFLWPTRASVSQWEVLPLQLMVVGLFKWAAGLWGYSGFEKPPLFGDYEAQRHWMEVTTHVPISQWYFYDLEWWGLDYPPLTAYHSWVCGKMGSYINPAWFALDTSRGIHDANLKIFMRATVVVSDFLIFVPAVVMFVRRYRRLSAVSTWSASLALVAVLMQPATILIDNVHFQYNSVMLGFVAASMSAMVAGRYSWAAVFFVAALGFKQMALFYALPVFAFLAGSCVFPRANIPRFLGIATATLLAFAVLLLPLVLGALHDGKRGIVPTQDAQLPLFPWLEAYVDRSAVYWPVVQQLVQMVHRVFPVARGLFEDKVANFWCAVNLVVKLKQYPPELLQQASLLSTVAFSAVPNLVLFVKPKKELLPLAFATTAWAFFLFGFQVHEKSVLLPLMPMTLLLAGNNGLGKETRQWVGFVNLLGCWTMFPLLQRVHLRIPYYVFTLLWAYLLGLPPTTLAVYFPDTQSAAQWLTFLLHALFYLAMAGWHVVEAAVPPPKDKPDLWTVANVGVGAAGFGLCYVWCFYRLLVDAKIFSQKGKSGKNKRE